MAHHTSRRFWERFNALPREVQELANRNYALLCADPTHPSLHFREANGRWTVRVGLHYRALAYQSGDDYVWYWIGTHAEYDRLIRQQ